MSWVPISVKVTVPGRDLRRCKWFGHKWYYSIETVEYRDTTCDRCGETRREVKR